MYYQMMFVSFNSTTICATIGAGTDFPSGAAELTLRFFVEFLLLTL
jgi:hypothetical protein